MRAPAGWSGADPQAVDRCVCQMAIMTSKSVGGVAGSSSGGGNRGSWPSRLLRPASLGPRLPGGPEAALRTPLRAAPVPEPWFPQSSRGACRGAAVAEAGRRALAGPALRGRPAAGGSMGARPSSLGALAGCDRDRRLARGTCSTSSAGGGWACSSPSTTACSARVMACELDLLLVPWWSPSCPSSCACLRGNGGTPGPGKPDA